MDEKTRQVIKGQVDAGILVLEIYEQVLLHTRGATIGTTEQTFGWVAQHIMSNPPAFASIPSPVRFLGEEFVNFITMIWEFRQTQHWLTVEYVNQAYEKAYGHPYVPDDTG